MGGELDPETFQSVGIILIASSSVMIVMVFVGCFGALYQTVRLGHCQGRKLLGTYQLCLMFILIFQFYSTIFCLNSWQALEDVKDHLKHGNSSVEYVYIEERISPHFNDYYFDTLDKQDSSKNDWFWSFVDDNCPDSMSTDNCNADSYAASCPDETGCDHAPDNDRGDCPFDVCRIAANNKVIKYLKPVGQYGIFVFLVEVGLLVLTCTLSCFNPRDTDAEILTKSGTLSSGMELRRAHRP